MGSEFYNMSRFCDNALKCILYTSKGKSVIAERFIRTLKSKIYKHDYSIKKVLINKLDKIVNKYNITQRATTIKPADVMLGVYIECGVEHNKSEMKFKVGDVLRIPRYKKIFTQGYNASWSEKVFLISEMKKYCVPWKCVISEKMKRLFEHSMKTSSIRQVIRIDKSNEDKS